MECRYFWRVTERVEQLISHWLSPRLGVRPNLGPITPTCGQNGSLSLIYLDCLRQGCRHHPIDLCPHKSPNVTYFIDLDIYFSYLSDMLHAGTLLHNILAGIKHFPI